MIHSSAPDFSKPGDDGALPEGFARWRWGVTYTVHPKFHAPVEYGVEHRVVVSVLRKIAGEDPGYAFLYERAAQLVRGRATCLRCTDPDTLLHTRILAQGWFTHANANLARAFVTLGATYLKAGDPLPQGQSAPTAEAFAAPGGMTPENTAMSSEDRNKRVYEIYTDADVRDPASSDTNIFTMSYGEYVPSCGEVHYAPLVERAQELAQFHFSINSSSNDAALRIVRREWFCATNPDIAVVHLYIQT
jgi:hypothetical protein